MQGIVVEGQDAAKPDPRGEPGSKEEKKRKTRCHYPLKNIISNDLKVFL